MNWEAFSKASPELAALGRERFDVESAGFVMFGDDAYGMAWDPERGTHRWRQREE